MSDAMNPVEELDERECWELLELAPFGRLALAAGGEIDIFPINYAIHDGALYLRTAPGTKLVELTAHPEVALEIDGWDEGEAYSVVVKGVAERLEAAADIEHAESAVPLTPWAPTLKYRWVRIRPRHVTGRRFRRGPEPERD
ncbi:pyridoxamine 5'-phosphate oxidase family protein [Homoserinibacter sp. GY 40078]|uniref:pyridoxamine 5'-phosphate oxidase family protein n=1 Tax=Homoserinibacter sp. GY 40078 TaxID=2603275 RepID=UPI0011C8B171|nr:pyridoxamine 5'-phosphate oxidase family protein [Homoserinibacter sp. GY 40078]TXK16354.1 pyridoxamine 5'-phosphate oxidase family protein [Homoserinibacter sp. GY 40078]